MVVREDGLPTIPLLYEGPDFIAVCKPVGISSIPERDLAVPSVRTLLEKQLGIRLYTVHRLDKEVSGVMLFAKTADAHRYLNAAFFDRNVKKTYIALVHGVIASDSGTIDAPIRQFGSGRMGVDAKNGKSSITRYSVLERRDQFTLIEAYPLSGRRHQIRVHFYHIGHPIAGDARYGKKSEKEQFARIMLHARRIALKNREGIEMVIEAEVPDEFNRITFQQSE
jgi:tRNA pseudouridine32 synthase/23S rRNA pseudouridine746 synthase